MADSELKLRGIIETAKLEAQEAHVGYLPVMVGMLIVQIEELGRAVREMPAAGDKRIRALDDLVNAQTSELQRLGEWVKTVRRELGSQDAKIETALDAIQKILTTQQEHATELVQQRQRLGIE